jgi:hypothetical protein
MDLLKYPSLWHARALDIRRLADASADPVYRAKLQEIAASYDLLAVRALAGLDSVPDTAHAPRVTPLPTHQWPESLGTGPLASEGLQNANATRPP